MENFCNKCGAALEQDAKFCVNCGNRIAVDAEQPVQSVQPEFQASYVNQSMSQQQIYQTALSMTEKEFYKTYMSKNSKSYVVFSIVSCVLTCLLSVVGATSGNLLSIIDIIVYALAGILIWTTKRWPFALVMVIYSGIGTVIGMAMTGQANGIVALVMGIGTTRCLHKFAKVYDAYKKTGNLPEKQI